jgi:hypothetical protein
MEAQIHQEVYDFFVNLLDEIGVVKKISLVLYTRGGSTLAGWSRFLAVFSGTAG